MRWQARLWRWWFRGRSRKTDTLECDACGVPLMRLRVQGIDVYVCPNGCGGE